ncbi:helix-turn-helix domain-containing protein [Amycolatopsis sp. NPDC059027]
MLEPSDAGQERRNLADVLRELRLAAGLSGERLAAKTHMSQSKISRIETGKILPAVTDVDRVLRALAVPPEQAEQLLRLASAANVDFMSRRQVRRIGIDHTQRTLRALIEQATTVRYFLPASLPSFLQTESYIRSNLENPLKKTTAAQREMLVAVKLDRRKLVERNDTAFVLVLTEDAIRFPMVNPALMVEQIDVLIEMSRLPSVRLGIIPAATQLQKSPLNTFVVYDERLVTMETFAGTIALRDPSHVEDHRELFEYFADHAVFECEMRALLAEIAVEFREKS